MVPTGSAGDSAVSLRQSDRARSGGASVDEDATRPRRTPRARDARDIRRITIPRSLQFFFSLRRSSPLRGRPSPSDANRHPPQVLGVDIRYRHEIRLLLRRLHVGSVRQFELFG
jgi:hypothetical protein